MSEAIYPGFNGWKPTDSQVKEIIEQRDRLIKENEILIKGQLSQFQEQVGGWGDKTFNPKKENNSTAIIHHLKKEVAELQESNNPEEAADCFLLLLQHAHSQGYDLLDEARKKMVINKERQWGLPDENGVIVHI
jgi:NTP pyrophosphatase (non-canonical NTP hydrolase)